MQPVSFDSVQKVSEIDLKVAAQFCPLFLKRIFFFHLCQGKCFDTRCGEPPAINNENAKILEHKRYFIDRGPLQGETSFEQAQYKIILRCFQ